MGRPPPGGEEAGVVRVQPRGVGLNTPGSRPGRSNTTPRCRNNCKFSDRRNPPGSSGTSGTRYRAEDEVSPLFLVG
ncbi:hypothetical protein FNU77_22115 [Prescottella equi]|nr:hypothetical protein FNU77_22115 [Prescottella equi]